MEIGYLRIYRDELDNDAIFNSYLENEYSIHHEPDDEDGSEWVLFYIIDVNDVPSKYLQ